ncbi:ABC transporter substrate-binding protein, partial [Streptomyces sp. SID12501]
NGSPTFERNFNPYSSNKRNTASYIYEPLVIVNEMSGDEPPWLAESYEQPDASTVVFHLRDGVTWSDGEELTADDVVFTFDLLLQHPQLDLRGVGEHIASVEADGSDVIVHLSSEDVPGAVIIAQTMIVPEHLWADVDDPVTFT